MISLASAAFGVVAALAWNSAITALVKQIFGTGAQIVSLFIYAIIVTILAVIVMVNLAKLAERTAPPTVEATEDSGAGFIRALVDDRVDLGLVEQPIAPFGTLEDGTDQLGSWLDAALLEPENHVRLAAHPPDVGPLLATEELGP